MTQVKAHTRKTKKGQVGVRPHTRGRSNRIKVEWQVRHRGVTAKYNSEKEAVKIFRSLRTQYPDSPTKIFKAYYTDEAK